MIKSECQERLAITEPHLKAAIAAVKSLSANYFTVIKSFNNPPAGVRLALEASCIMLNIKGRLLKLAISTSF